MEKTLELVFNKSDGTKKTVSIADPRADVTLANVLTSGGEALVEFVEARIKTVTVSVLA